MLFWFSPSIFVFLSGFFGHTSKKFWTSLLPVAESCGQASKQGVIESSDNLLAFFTGLICAKFTGEESPNGVLVLANLAHCKEEEIGK